MKVYCSSLAHKLRRHITGTVNSNLILSSVLDGTTKTLKWKVEKRETFRRRNQAEAM